MRGVRALLGVRTCGACGRAWRVGRAGVGGERGAWLERAAGRAAGPAGCTLGARNLFLARFDSVFFRSQLFGHCS